MPIDILTRLPWKSGSQTSRPLHRDTPHQAAPHQAGHQALLQKEAALDVHQDALQQVDLRGPRLERPAGLLSQLRRWQALPWQMSWLGEKQTFDLLQRRNGKRNPQIPWQLKQRQLPAQPKRPQKWPSSASLPGAHLWALWPWTTS